MIDETTAGQPATADTNTPPASTTLKQRIEKDWSELEGFVKTMELKLFGSKLHQKAVHPLSGESAWVEVETDQTQEHKDAVARGPGYRDPGKFKDPSVKDLTGKEDPNAVPPGGLHPAAAAQAHYPSSVSGAPAPLPGGVVAPGGEQGSPTGTPPPPNVVVAESPAPGASPAVVGTATST
jgi:hypothetical protein